MWFSSGGQKGQQRPPPRPIHRYPSWEDRIYQVASEGMRDATGGGDQIDSKNNNAAENGYGSDINVPVYATVKGVSAYIDADILQWFTPLVKLQNRWKMNDKEII